MVKNLTTLLAITALFTVTLAGCVVTEPAVEEENLPVNEEVVEETTPETQVADCTVLGDTWDVFTSEETPLSFCYLIAWGEPTLKETDTIPEAMEGTNFYVTFPNSEMNIPRISYQSIDYLLTGDRGGPAGLDWAKVDLSLEKEALSEGLMLGWATEEVTVIEDVKVNESEAIKVYRNFFNTYEDKEQDEINYYAPAVTIDEVQYNLEVRSNLSVEDDVDTMVESMLF